MGKFNPDNVLLTNAKTGAIPSTYAELIVKRVIENSKIMQLGQYKEMKDKDGKPVQEIEFTYLAEGPGAYWVGEGERIQTSKAKWLKAKMVSKKLGVIIPVSREFLHYSVADFFTQIKPLIAEAFYKKFDEAGILNVGNPFGQSVEGSITTTAQKVTGEINYDNILKLEDKLLDKNIEGNAFVSKTQNKSLLRAAVKNENGVSKELYDRTANTIDGLPVVELKSDEIKKGTLYLGDWNYLYYGIPYTLTYSVSEDATLSTIKNEDDTEVNLFEQELIALRATMDVALMVVKDEAFAKLAATEA